MDERAEAVVYRVVYVFIVNVLFGIGGAIVLTRHWVRAGAIEVMRSG